MAAADDNDDLTYISELRFGRYLAILLSVFLATICTMATGIYHPTRADRLWPLVSRKPLPAHVEPLDDSTVISLRRTMCFGWCPAYVVRILGSGRVEYRGGTYVCAFGAHTATADVREVRRLVEAMIGTGFFGYSWKPGPFSPDHPTVTTVLKHAGQSYALRHHHDDQGAPRWLDAMEQEVDRIAGTARWLPRYGEGTGWRFLCSTPEGGTRDMLLEPIEDRLSLIIHPTIEAPRITPPPLQDLRE